MSVDTSLNWIARNPLPVTIGLLAVAVTLGAAWVYELTGTLTARGPLGGALLGLNVVVIFGSFIFGMYVRERIERI